MLETIEIETASKPDATIIWLHGLGADGHDFEPVVPQLVSRGERAWRFVFPHAPVRPVTVNGGKRMRAWYDITGMERNARPDIAGFRDTSAKVAELVVREVQRGIASKRIVLAGFSQGGAVSLYMLTRASSAFAGVVALSCYVPMPESLVAEKTSANDKTPIFMAHGQFDPVINISTGRDSRDLLLQSEFGVEWREYPMAHSVCAEELADIRVFLYKVLA